MNDTVLKQLRNLEMNATLEDELIGFSSKPLSIPSFEDLTESLENAEIVEPKLEIIEERSEKIISYTCYPNTINKLGNLKAKELHFQVKDISWQAGKGWPVYRTLQPQTNYSTSMRYKHIYRHKIVGIWGGTVWNLDSPNGYGVGEYNTDVYFAVNDDKYDDNCGKFKVVITGYR